MSQKSDGALAVFVIGLVIFMAGVVMHFMVGPLLLGGLLMLGAVVATTRQRRLGPAPEVTLRPGGKGRPWHRGSDDVE